MSNISAPYSGYIYDKEATARKGKYGEQRRGMMIIRITDDGSEKNISEIHAMLKEFNLSCREPSKNVPLGIYYENDKNEKLAG